MHFNKAGSPAFFILWQFDGDAAASVMTFKFHPRTDVF